MGENISSSQLARAEVSGNDQDLRKSSQIIRRSQEKVD